MAKQNISLKDPRKESFKRAYLDVKNKETFGNAYKSAIKAGYSKSYSEIISAPTQGNKWIKEIKQHKEDLRKRMLYRSEVRLDELIDSKDERISLETVKHITKTLGREIYGERGVSIQINQGVVMLPRKGEGNNLPLKTKDVLEEQLDPIALD